MPAPKQSATYLKDTPNVFQVDQEDIRIPSLSPTQTPMNLQHPSIYTDDYAHGTDTAGNKIFLGSNGVRILLLNQREYTTFEAIKAYLTAPIFLYRVFNRAAQGNDVALADPTYIAPTGPEVDQGGLLKPMR